MGNYLEPVVKFLRNIWSYHTPNISKTIQVEISQRYIKTYDSLLFSSPEKTEVFYSLMKNHETIGSGDDSLVLLNIQIGHDQEVYTREYEKISTSLAKLFWGLKNNHYYWTFFNKAKLSDGLFY